MKQVLLSAMIIASGIAAYAQYPTTVTPVISCSVFKNFNTTDEGFSSPSIYSNDADVEFRWNSVAGNEQEVSGLATRTASLISPAYTNPTNGQVTVGFSYVAPVGTEYRVRVITAVVNPPLEIIATTANGPVWTALPSTSGGASASLNPAMRPRRAGPAHPAEPSPVERRLATLRVGTTPLPCRGCSGKWWLP